VADACPDATPVPSRLSYDGDMLVATGAGGLATASLVASLSDGGGAALASGDVSFSLLASDGSLVLECSAVTNDSGAAVCVASGLAPDVYRVEASFETVPGCYESSSAGALLVVYDPNVPRATGGGFILPDLESTLPASGPQDKANFGFIVRLDKNQKAAGNLEFQYRAAGIDLKSLAMTWYTVSNNKAMFEGTATIGGAGLFTFRVTATDGDLAGGQPDGFDITIWTGTDTETDPLHRAKSTLAGGSIVVHRK
jgi:hypothetical protein